MQSSHKNCLESSNHYRNQSQVANVGVDVTNHVPLHVDLQHSHHLHDGPHSGGHSDGAGHGDYQRGLHEPGEAGKEQAESEGDVVPVCGLLCKLWGSGYPDWNWTQPGS